MQNHVHNHKTYELYTILEEEEAGSGGEGVDINEQVSSKDNNHTEYIRSQAPSPEPLRSEEDQA